MQCSLYNSHTIISYIDIYVGCKIWICAIHRLRCANHGSILRVTIHGFRAQSTDRAYIYGHKVQICGQSMDCAVQTTDCLIRSQVQYKDKLQVSGVPLASYVAGLYKTRARIAQSHSVISALQHCVTTLLPFVFRSTKVH